MADIKTVAIIGAGQMGCGIAHVLALSGLRVLLNDIGDSQIDAGLASIAKNLDRQIASETCACVRTCACLQEHLRIRSEYESKLAELEHERGGIEEDKAEKDRYPNADAPICEAHRAHMRAGGRACTCAAESRCV